MFYSKKMLLITLLSLCGGIAQAESGKKINPYIGMSGGIDHLSGKRSEFITEDDPVTGLVTTVLNNKKSMSNSNIELSLLGGFLWQPTASVFIIGSEAYLGRSSTKSRFTDVRPDLIPQNRYYSRDLERQYNFGFVARVGLKCNDFFVLLAIGLDRGRFKESTALTYDPTNILTVRTHKAKNLSGLVLGGSIEKKIQKFMVGLDFRYVRYARFSSSHTFDAGPGLIPGTLNFSARPKVYTTSLRLSYVF